MKKDERTPNDQRSDVKNPNNSDHKQDKDNRSNQLNPNHQESKDQDHPMKQRQGGSGASSRG